MSRPSPGLHLLDTRRSRWRKGTWWDVRSDYRGEYKQGAESGCLHHTVLFYRRINWNNEGSLSFSKIWPFVSSRYKNSVIMRGGMGLVALIITIFERPVYPFFCLMNWINMRSCPHKAVWPCRERSWEKKKEFHHVQYIWIWLKIVFLFINKWRKR